MHDTPFSTLLYFVMAEYIAKGDHRFHSLEKLITIIYEIAIILFKLQTDYRGFGIFKVMLF
jgi:hypothetical protein